MTPSKALFLLCIAFITGIGLASLMKIPQLVLWGFLISVIIFIVFALVSKSAHKTIFITSGFCMLFLVLGILRLQIAEFAADGSVLKKLNDTQQKITLEGRVSAEPDISNSYQKLKISVGRDFVLVTTDARTHYAYLDLVKVTGRLNSPKEFDDFNYKNYLMKDGIYSVMDFPKIELVSKEHSYNIFTFLYEKILILKSTFQSSTGKLFSPPYNFIVNGVVFGNDKDWPKDLKYAFSNTGLSHITAVSGGNIIVLIKVLVVSLLALGLWRQQSLYGSMVLIWIYIILVGFPASGVRAGIMGSILLGSEILGRQNTSSRTLALAGASMLFFNPLLLLYDVGFQLSFLASLGIIHFYPIIGNFLKFGWVFDGKPMLGLFKKGTNYFMDIVSVTLAAQFFTLPIIIYNFSNVSLVSPLTNLLALPIVPPLMVFGLLSSIFGVFFGYLGWALALPCYAIIFYLLKLLDVFNQPWAVANIKYVSFIWFFAYYAVIWFIIWFLKRKFKPKFLGY